MTIAQDRDTFPATLSRPWTSKEVARLRELAPLGADAAADELDRSVWSVKNAARRHRISLRRPGSRRGLILGQPRAVSFAAARDDAHRAQILAAIRADILTGRLDRDWIEKRTRWYERWLAAGSPLCMECMARPLEHDRTERCGPCHLRFLAEQHRNDTSRADARKAHQRERQASSRRRRRALSTGNPTRATREDQP